MSIFQAVARNNRLKKNRSGADDPNALNVNPTDQTSPSKTVLGSLHHQGKGKLPAEKSRGTSKPLPRPPRTIEDVPFRYVAYQMTISFCVEYKVCLSAGVKTSVY